MLKNLKKRRAQLYAQGELAEAKEYNFFPVSFEMPKVQISATTHLCIVVEEKGGSVVSASLRRRTGYDRRPKRRRIIFLEGGYLCWWSAI